MKETMKYHNMIINLLYIICIVVLVDKEYHTDE